MLRPNADPAEMLPRQLDALGQSALKKIAQTLGVAPRTTDRAGYLEALGGFIGTPRHQAILEARLPVPQWTLLDLLPIHAGPVYLRSLVAALRQSGTPPREELSAISTAFAYGCLLPVGALPAGQKLNIDPAGLSPWIGTAWFDLPPAVRDWVRQRQPASHQLQPVEPPTEVVGADLTALQRAVYLLLAEAAIKPIRLTYRGLPYKAEQVRLAAALAGTSGAAPRGARAKREAAPVPPVLWFALAALVDSGLLLDDEQQQLSPSSDVAAFRAAPYEAQALRLLSSWMTGHYDDFVRIPTLSFGDVYEPEAVVPLAIEADDSYYASALPLARAVICVAISLATRGKPDGWYAIDDLARLVHDDHPELLFRHVGDYELLNPHAYGGLGLGRHADVPYYGVYRRQAAPNGRGEQLLYPARDWPDVEGAFVRQVVGESLRWLGLVELGPDATQPERFRLTPLGRHLLTGAPLAAAAPTTGAPAVVQPNFDVVVVDALANAAILAQLDDFAERRSLDRAATYHLTQAALLRGLDRGWTGERVLQQLAAISGAPLPQNVGFTLREWIRLYERLSVRERTTLLEADDASQLDRWLADRELGPLLGRRLGPTAALVPSHGVERVTARIKVLAKRLAVVDYAQRRGQQILLREPDLIEAKSSDPYLVYRLRAFSAPIDADGPNAVYRITAESVAAAAKAGRNGLDIMNFLLLASGGQPPSDLLTRIYGWSGTLRPLTHESVVAVSIPGTTAVNWHVLTAIPSIGSLVRVVLSPSLALVPPDHFATLRAELAHRGIPLREGVIEPAIPAPPALRPATGSASDLMRQALARIVGDSDEDADLLEFPTSWFRRKKR